jgi:hypothetical protein
VARRTAFFALVLAVVAPVWAAEPESVNDKVVKFCKAKLGKEVGNGECTGLVEAALAAAGAQTSRDFKDSPNDGDYVWGEQVYLLAVKDGKRTEEAAKGQKVKPGDVVQFRDAKFAGRLAAGAFYTTTSPHHTAVVVGVQNGGRTLVVLHQNVNGKKAVSQQSYNLADLREGWVRAYRPVEK